MYSYLKMKMKMKSCLVVGAVVEPPLNHPSLFLCFEGASQPIFARPLPTFRAKEPVFAALIRVCRASTMMRRWDVVGTLLAPPLQGWLKHPCQSTVLLCLDRLECCHAASTTKEGGCMHPLLPVSSFARAGSPDNRLDKTETPETSSRKKAAPVAR